MLKKTMVFVLVFVLLTICIPMPMVNASLSNPETYDVLLVSSNGTNKPFFPSITKSSNGDLYVSYYWSPTHGGDIEGVVRLIKSTDNGATWSTPVTILDQRAQGFDVRGNHINMLSNGDLALTFFLYRYVDAVKVKGAYFCKSSDGGVTWSTPVMVPTTNKDGYNAICGPAIEVGNGELMLATYGPDPDGRTRVTISKSSDGGATWGSETTVAYDNNEAGLAYVGNNIVYCIVRPSGNIYRSTDNGATWSLYTVTSTTMHAPDFYKIDDTRLFTTWCRPGASGGDRAVEGKLYYPEKGWNYTPTRLIYASSGSSVYDMGYPGSVLTNDNRVLTVYYDTHNQIIAGTYTKLSDWEPRARKGQKINLLSKYNAGQITVNTDMTWTSPDYPGVRVSGAFDGSVSYFNAAFKGNSTVPSHYIINLDRVYDITTLGICLKPSYAGSSYKESADIYFSTDGVNWGDPVKSYVNESQDEVKYTNFTTPIPAKHVKVVVTQSQGWPVLNEIELYSLDTFEYDTVGQVPMGYSVVGASGVVSNAQAYEGTKSLRIYDNSASVLTNVVRTTEASSYKELEFNIYPVAAPNGNVICLSSGGNENTNNVFHIGIFSDGSVKYYNGAWNVIGGPGTIGFNTWSKIRIEAQDTTSAKIYINDVLIGTAGKWRTFSTIDRVRFQSGSTKGTGDDFYIDNLMFTRYE
ncbi:MAG TPA: hypothetical protein GXX20_06020 [Clostridiaceae bacterium]|nr:hypothetical protein [Clostridiaceae bacterium]